MRILIISEFIAPFQAVASIRWTKISKYLKKQHEDIEIDVLTIKRNYEDDSSIIPFSLKDPLLEKDISVFLHYFEIENGLIYNTYRRLKKIINGCKIGAGNVENYNLRKGSQEIKAAYKMERLGKYIYYRALRVKEIFSGDYDIVISSYGPTWPHYVAKKIKEKLPNTIWIADFRDSYVASYDNKRKQKKHKEFTSKVLKDADLILKVNHMLLVYEGKNQHVEVLTNGYDYDEHVSALPPSKFVLLFTGGLVTGYADLRPIFKAVQELIKEEKINKQDVVLEYAGYNSDEFDEQASAVGVSDLTENYGVVARDHVLTLQRSCAILLQTAMTNEHTKMLWTGKMYEYMMSGKPIIYSMLGMHNEYVFEGMKHLGGECYEECNHEESYQNIKQYIYEKYVEWKTTGNVSIKQDKEYVQQFSYEKIAETLYDLICNLDKKVV